MNNIQTRFLLFLFGCIGTRLAFTALSAFASVSVLKILGYLALLPVIGWFYIILLVQEILDWKLEVGKYGGNIYDQSI